MPNNKKGKNDRGRQEVFQKHNLTLNETLDFVNNLPHPLQSNLQPPLPSTGRRGLKEGLQKSFEDYTVGQNRSGWKAVTDASIDTFAHFPSQSFMAIPATVATAAILYKQYRQGQALQNIQEKLERKSKAGKKKVTPQNMGRRALTLLRDRAIENAPVADLEKQSPSGEARREREANAAKEAKRLATDNVIDPNARPIVRPPVSKNKVVPLTITIPDPTPEAHTGGIIKRKTGTLYKLKKGEMIVPTNRVPAVKKAMKKAGLKEIKNKI